jgi:hypothetical protein
MATTYAQIIARARQRTDMVENEFVDDTTELLLWAGDDLAELDDLLIRSSDDYKLTTTARTVAAGADYFAVPDDFLALRGVDRQVSGAWATLDRFSLAERNRYADQVGIAGRWCTARYRLAGARVYITPADSAPGAYQIHYVPKFTAPTATSDALPTYMDTQAWHAFAVASLCAKIKAKQDLDPGVFLQDRAEQRQRVLDAAHPRDKGSPRRVVNTRRRRRSLLEDC